MPAAATESRRTPSLVSSAAFANDNGMPSRRKRTSHRGCRTMFGACQNIVRASILSGCGTRFPDVAFVVPDRRRVDRQDEGSVSARMRPVDQLLCALSTAEESTAGTHRAASGALRATSLERCGRRRAQHAHGCRSRAPLSPRTRPPSGWTTRANPHGASKHRERHLLAEHRRSQCRSTHVDRDTRQQAHTAANASSLRSERHLVRPHHRRRSPTPLAAGPGRHGAGLHAYCGAVSCVEEFHPSNLDPSFHHTARDRPRSSRCGTARSVRCGRGTSGCRVRCHRRRRG